MITTTTSTMSEMVTDMKPDIKLNLHCGTQVRSDFTANLDSRLPAPHADCQYIGDNYILSNEPGTVSEILVNAGCLESLSREQIITTLTNWHTSLKPGGFLKVYYCDIMIMANWLLYYNITIQDFEKQLFGCKTCLDMYTMKAILTQTGFAIESQEYYNQLGIIHVRKQS